MTLKLLAALILTAAIGAPVGYVFYRAQLSPDNWVYQGGSVTNWKDGGVHGADVYHGLPRRPERRTGRPSRPTPTSPAAASSAG